MELRRSGVHWRPSRAGKACIVLLLILSLIPLTGVGQAAYANDTDPEAITATHEWQVVGDGIFASESSKPVVAFDSGGTPYVVYEDSDHGNKLTVKKYNGSHWDTVGDPGFSTLVYGDFVSLVIDGNDIPYVLYSDKENNTGATVMKYDQDELGQLKWMTVGSPNFTQNGTYDTLKHLKLAIDRVGTPYVAYFSMNYEATPLNENGTFKINVKKYVTSSNSWVRVGSKSIGGRDGAFLDIAFDRSGSTDIPYVLYQDTQSNNARGTVKKYDSSSNSWVAVGNSTSTGYLWFASIAINGSGIPYIAFGDGGDSEKAYVKKLVGSSWETVGGAEVSEGAVSWPTMVLDGSDTPYVVYQDKGNYDPVTRSYSGGTYKSFVKKLEGSSWVTVGGGEISSSEAYAASIAFDGNDTPYVAYWDISNTVVVKKYAPIVKYTANASADTATPEVGADNEITLTVKNAVGDTDTTFNGAHDVTISGSAQALDGSYGSFNGTALTTGPNTIGIVFTNGVATANLKLNKAAAQTIGFSVAGVVTPETNFVSITPAAGSAVSMALSTDLIAPASNGGAFVRQPVVTLLDVYGNTSTGDNSTVVTASKQDSGEWTLTGTTTATASAGIAAFTDLGTTNVAEVTGARLAFDASGGLARITSQSVTLQSPGVVAPTVESVTAGDGHALLAWSDVLGSVTYAVYRRTDSEAYGDALATVTGSVYDATGLTNGTTYYFVVKALYPSGISAASNEVSATPRTVPSAPGDVTAVAGNGEATVSFTVPANGGSPITSYEVTAMPGNMTVTGTVSPITVTGLTNGVTYSFTIKAFNSAGSSTASDASDPVTPRAPSSGPPSSTPTVPYDPAPPETTDPETDPEQPPVDVFDRNLIDVANLVKRIETKIEEAKKANAELVFADIQGHWADKSIHIFAELRLIEGYGDGTFKPDGKITRAEFAVLLNRVFDIQGGDNTNAELKDIGNNWAKEAIRNLVAAGVIHGYGDGTFKPEKTITREEMVTMLSRVINFDNVAKDSSKGNFNDLAGSYAADEIIAGAQAGIINGKANGRFDAGSNASRAEAIQIILNALKLNPQVKALLDSIS